jgi:hypothetical protein
MNKDLIKKELYKQKPDADFNYEESGFKNYSCLLIIDGIEEIIEFYIPLKECDFEEVVPAQLLIRWIK